MTGGTSARDIGVRTASAPAGSGRRPRRCRRGPPPAARPGTPRPCRRAGPQQVRSTFVGSVTQVIMARAPPRAGVSRPCREAPIRRDPDGPQGEVRDDVHGVQDEGCGAARAPSARRRPRAPPGRPTRTRRSPRRPTAGPSRGWWRRRTKIAACHGAPIENACSTHQFETREHEPAGHRPAIATGRASRAWRSDSRPRAIERAVRMARSEPRNGSRCSTLSARRRTRPQRQEPDQHGAQDQDHGARDDQVAGQLSRTAGRTAGPAAGSPARPGRRPAPRRS